MHTYTHTIMCRAHIYESNQIDATTHIAPKIKVGHQRTLASYLATRNLETHKVQRRSAAQQHNST